jgi:hypothetical protein
VLEIVSTFMIFFFSIGVPVFMAVRMTQTKRQRQRQFETPTWQYISRRVMSQLSQDNLKEVQHTLIDIALGTRYGALISGFKPGYFFWECLDMMRKLVVVGMLTTVERGSTTQVVAGIVFSFIFFAAHIRTLPYRHMEDNILKATTEGHLFIVFLMVLTLKSDLHGEVLGADAYDFWATVLFVIMVPCTAIGCIGRKWYLAVTDDVESSNDKTYTESLKTSFNRIRMFRDKDEDRNLVANYIAKLLDEVESDYHVFISYRVASEKELARQLCDELAQMTLSETGQKLRVFLDQIRLKDGERWDTGFMAGLSSSWIVVPIISTAALLPMRELNKENDSVCDNVLLEWIAALELHERGAVRAIIPIIACDETGNDFSWGLPKDLSQREHSTTTTAARKHLSTLGSSSARLVAGKDVLEGVAQVVADISSDDTKGEVTVAGVVAATLRFQGALLSQRTDLSQCTDRIFSKVTEILGCDSTDAKIDGDTFDFEAERLDAVRLSQKGGKLRSSDFYEGASGGLASQTAKGTE